MLGAMITKEMLFSGEEITFDREESPPIPQ